jgi:lipopolysaccharide/colanic/teichoic acid biosynthesis glycosyltransferase
MHNNRILKAGAVIDRHTTSTIPDSYTPIQKRLFEVEAAVRKHIRLNPRDRDFYDELKADVKKHILYLQGVERMPDVELPGWYLAVKRGMDIFVGVTGLILLSPLFLIVAAMVKIDSRGPVIFSQERVGKDGKLFKIYKFRTLIDNAEEKTGPRWIPDGDPCITFIGKFLRKSKIDEFPQFVNLVKGEITLVGPRPERPYFVDPFADIIPGYVRRLDVTPGITGAAQLRNGYDRNTMSVIRKLRYDVTYMKKMGLSMDLGLLWETFWRMLTGKF